MNSGETRVWFRDTFNGKDLGRYCLVTILLILSLPQSLYYGMTATLDGSWMLGIHMAIEKGLWFGSDIIFTYGPLGFLAIRMPFGVSVYSYFIFDLYVLLNLLFVFNGVLKKGATITNFIISFLIITLTQDFRDHDIVVVLTWLALYMLFTYYEQKNVFLLVNATLLVTITFFAKINFGIIVLFILILFLGFLVYSKIKTFRYVLIFTACYLFFFIVTSYLLKASLIKYFVGSLHLINAFNDAMYVPLIQEFSNPGFLSAVFIFVLAILAIIPHFKLLKHDSFLIFIYCVTALAIYVLFKQGYVRLHTEGFFQFVTPFISLLFLFSRGVVKKNAGRVVLASLFICWLNQGTNAMIFNDQIVKDKIAHISLYYNQFKSYDRQLIHNSLQDQKAQSNLKLKIPGSVDIIPADISFLYINELNYNPRPVIQSYSAYDSYLDRKNADKYHSKSGPEYVMAKFSSIDDRYPLFDETETKLELLTRYDVIGKEFGHLLLQKQTIENERRTKEVFKGNGRIFEYTTLNESTKELQCLSASIEYSLLGKIRRFFYQPPELFITVITERGLKKDYRAITSILKGGVIINRFIPKDNNLEEFSMFMTFNGECNERIVSYKFWTPQSWGFKPNFSFTISQIKFQGHKKSEIMYKNVNQPIPLSTNNIQYNIEKIKNTEDLAVIDGWAFVEGENFTDADINIVLKSRAESYVFPCEKIERGDVSSFFKDSLTSSGFRAVILHKYVRDGEYDLGVMVKMPAHNFFRYVGKKVRFSAKGLPIGRDLWDEADSKFNIDNFLVDEFKISLNGWAFSEAVDNSYSKIAIVLESEYDFKMVDAEIDLRNDINPFFHRNDLARSGFKISLKKSSLNAGEYKIGILIDNRGQKTFLRTDNSVTIL